MPDDQYSELDTEAAPSDTSQQPAGEEGGETALIPKSLVGDAKPGDTITFTISKVYEDEVAVTPAGEESKPEPSGSMMDELDGMGGD